MRAAVRQGRSSTLDRAADQGVAIWLPDVVVAELAYVLTSVYELGVTEAAHLLGRILDVPGLEVADEPLLRDALLLWEETRLGVTDSYLAALGRGVEGAGVLSFDRGFDRAEGVVRIDSATPGSS